MNLYWACRIEAGREGLRGLIRTFFKLLKSGNEARVLPTLCLGLEMTNRKGNGFLFGLQE
jgi:hypothetical protein